MLLCCFKAFLGKLTGNISFYSKKWLRKKLFFPTSLKRGNSRRKFEFFKKCLRSNQLKANINKTVFLLKVSHIQHNYAFVLFWSTLGKFTGNISFYSKKWLRKKLRNTLKCCFSQQVWKVANPVENLYFLNNCFWSNQKKGTNINKICFSTQSEPHTA